MTGEPEAVISVLNDHRPGVIVKGYEAFLSIRVERMLMYLQKILAEQIAPDFI
jgi:hypothetical protein